jgi:NAD(P)-dependent dehydrogenase (short-subunit alcohol dehydrogenase family)
VNRIAAESGVDSASELGLDLASLASVRDLAREIESRNVPLRALVCNAGLQVYGPLRTSVDGFELTFAANHLGHFLLTNLLLARLARNAPARIVVVSSGVHDPSRFTGMPKAAVSDVATLAATGGPTRGTFSGPLAYVNSKLCNLWFTYELARRVEAAGLAGSVTVNAYEPGLVPGSALARDYPAPLRFIWGRVLPGLARVLTAVLPEINPAPKSGAALAGMVTDPALATVTGRYFPSRTRWREGRSSEASHDRDRARALWEESVRMTHLTPEDSPLCRE